MPDALTPMQKRGLAYLRPGTWCAASLATVGALRSVAKHHPDLCESALRETASGLVPEYRLTEAGERVRAELDDTDTPTDARMASGRR